MIPARMGNEHLAQFLRRVADAVERGDSLEGSISWGFPGQGAWDGEFAPAEGQHVLAMVRVGTRDGGQGGAWVVGQAEDDRAEIERQRNQLLRREQP